MCLLLKHKANQYLRNYENIEPLDVAIRQANANIVTLYVLIYPVDICFCTHTSKNNERNYLKVFLIII